MNVTSFSISTTSDFLDFCELINASEKQYIFRGLESQDYSLSTSVERDIPDADINRLGYALYERVALHHFFKLEHLYTPPSPYDSSNLVEVWSIIQHYGGRTRLLDFTYSPAVALHFAIWNHRKTSDPLIWCIPKKRLHNQLETFHKSQPGKVEDLKSKGFIKIPGAPDGWSLIPFVPLSDELNQLINYLLRISLNSFGFDELLRDCVVSLEPDRPNHRLLMQNGLFLLPLNSKNTFLGNLSGFLGHEVSLPTQSQPLETSLDRLRQAIENEDIVILRLGACKHKALADLLLLMNVRIESVFPDFAGLMTKLANVGPLREELR